jgi:carbonic anhydrase
MSVSERINETIAQNEDWVLRRQKGITNNLKLFVLTCMDERLPIEEALGLQPGDAHIFRNAGGLVTDDVIRSAALTLNFFGTKEIIVVNHTECGMMTAHGHEIVNGLVEKLNVDIHNVPLDPSLPELVLSDSSAIEKWIRTFENVDEITVAQVEYLRNHPLIPKDTIINGYIYEVETGRLRKPHRILSKKVNTREELREEVIIN